MFALLLILFLAVIVLGIKARANPALRLPAVVVALAAAALAGVRLITFAPEGRMPIEIPPEEALGFILANRVLEDFPDGGKVIVFQPQADENYEWTTDLDGAWTASGASDGVITVDLTVGAPTPAASGYESVTVTVTATPATAAELFARLRLDVP